MVRNNMALSVAVLLVCLVFWLLVVLHEWLALHGPSEPVGLTVVQIRSNVNMADVLTYRVSAGAPVDSDVVSRILSVTVNGEEKGSTSYPVSEDLGVVVVPQDAVVKLSLVDVDDAGNVSPAAEYEFTAVDTLPPAQPGFLGVTLVSESPAPEAPVTPEEPTA
jgi:hypothetical protein